MELLHPWWNRCFFPGWLSFMCSYKKQCIELLEVLTERCSMIWIAQPHSIRQRCWVKWLLDWQRGPNSGSALWGKSVHNHRNERLWRDVYIKVLHKFYQLFYHLEDTKSLETDNGIHMFALHYVYLPRIRLALHDWSNIHNQHGFRT